MMGTSVAGPRLYALTQAEALRCKIEAMPLRGPGIVGHQAPASAEGHVKGAAIGPSEAHACRKGVPRRHMLDLASLRRECSDAAIHDRGCEHVGLSIDRQPF